MKIADLEFDKKVVKDLMDKPLLRDNIKNIEGDFDTVFSKFMATEVPEELKEDARKMKSDSFAAFCHGIQVATRVDSKFRQGYKIPKEFDPTDAIIANSKKKKSGLILP